MPHPALPWANPDPKLGFAITTPIGLSARAVPHVRDVVLDYCVTVEEAFHRFPHGVRGLFPLGLQVFDQHVGQL